MPRVFYGTKDEPGFDLEQSADLLAVRTRSGRSISRSTGSVPSPLSAELADGVLVAAYPEAGVEVYRLMATPEARSMSERKSALRASPDVRFAGGVLVDPVSKAPVLYTENLFVKFIDSANPEDCRANLRSLDLSITSEVSYATNAFFVSAREGTGQAVFDIASALLQRDDVEMCHPELIRPRLRKTIFPQQWHLRQANVQGVSVNAHANVEAAHAISRGEGVTIAIIDDGIDIDHPEFAGSGKVVAPRDASLQSRDPRPKDPDGTGPDRGENHGTACAGVACANGHVGASGVAPQARLMPIRLASGLGSQREAEAFQWAADNGADVISCSWGPPDGEWWNAKDPCHTQHIPLPASTRLAIDYAITNGRGGKGCVLLFAAGNGNEPVDNDGYASYPKVIAVAACNDRGRRSVYSDYGKALWCAFPSNDFAHPPLNHPSPLTSGIWTTDRLGRHGYNGQSANDGDPSGQFTNSFGGTSSACPGAAGVAALALSVNPSLRWNEVKDLLRRACDRIDSQAGRYDAVTGHSTFYGYGRLNALTAVNLARSQPRSQIMVGRTFDAPIPDRQTVVFSLPVADISLVETVAVSVDIRHGSISDLVVTLLPPPGIGLGAVVLHNRTGGAGRNLNRTYDAGLVPALARVAGKNCAGTWKLEIRDAVTRNIGTLVSFNLLFTLTHPSRATRQPIMSSNRPT